jgi:CRISPR-associated protein Csb2
MPGRALLVEVRLLNDRWHGVGDWPPSPFRLFQALIAGAYGGRWRAEDETEKDSAFRWLERLPPPVIAAPPKLEGRATTYYVPNNDLDAVGGDPRRVEEIRVAKLSRATLVRPPESFLYVWSLENGEVEAQRIARFAERLYTLGRGLDAAFAHGEVVEAAHAEARLVTHGGTVSRPGWGDASNATPCPAPGSLDSLKARYAATAERLRTQEGARTGATLFRQPPKALFRTVAYDRPPARLLFDLRPASGEGAFRPSPQETVVSVAIAVRDLLARNLGKAFPHEAERLIIGRGAGPEDLERRVRIIPLPTIGHPHASPAIRRVLVDIPPDCPLARTDITWALAGRTLPGSSRVDSETGEIEETLLVPSEEDSMLRNYGVKKHGRDGRQFRWWCTVTPVALPDARPRGKLSAVARAAADDRAAAAVVQALRHAGLAARPLSIRLQVEPFHARGARAATFAADRFEARRLRHVEIELDAPIEGPVVIGDGRFLGLGLMRPLSRE